MSNCDHPSSAELLLWQSGELSPTRTRELRRHLAGCAQCTDKVETLESLYGEIASTRREAAGHRFHQAVLLKRQQSFWSKLYVIPRWTAVTASTVIAALLLATFAEYTPSARAEVLLSRAVKQEAVRPAPSHLLNIKSSGMNCNVLVRHDVGVVLVTDSDQNLCGRVDKNLHDTGWNWNDLLSARSFKQWRDELGEKKDAITRMSNATEVTTTTNEGAIQSATLRLRSTDYRPMRARFVFASRVGGDPLAFEVTASEEVPEEIAKNATLTHPEAARSVHLSSLPVVDPMDTAEADVRLAIHHLGADKNVLLAVTHMPDAIRVTGIAPPPMADLIASSLAGFPQVETRIGSEDSTPSSTVWRSFRGDAPPLAYDEINVLYSSDTDRRQNFVNEVDAVTLRLAGEARAMDGLVPLANRLAHTSQGLQLQLTAAEVQANTSADLSALALLLKPVIGPSTVHDGRLSYPQATQLYTLVHELVSANRSDNTLTLDETADRIKRLISGN